MLIEIERKIKRKRDNDSNRKGDREKGTETRKEISIKLERGR